jgi:hypothetical protein
MHLVLVLLRLLLLQLRAQNQQAQPRPPHGPRKLKRTKWRTRVAALHQVVLLEQEQQAVGGPSPILCLGCVPALAVAVVAVCTYLLSDHIFFLASPNFSHRLCHDLKYG